MRRKGTINSRKPLKVKVCKIMSTKLYGLFYISQVIKMLTYRFIRIYTNFKHFYEIRKFKFVKTKNTNNYEKLSLKNGNFDY